MTMARMLVGLTVLAGVSPSAAEESASPPVFFALSVADLEASIAWYRDTLDLTVDRLPEADRAKVAILRGNGLMVELIEHADAFDLTSRAPEAGNRYLVHGLFKVGFFVENLDAVVGRLREKGAQIRGRVITDQANGVRTVLVLDNSGNIIQLFERVE